jgi:hypothetical protein
MFTKNELYLAHGSLNQNIKDVKAIFTENNHDLTDEESELLNSALPKMEKLKNKISGYIKNFDVKNEAKQVYVFKITFFFRDGSISVSTIFPTPKYLECTSENLLTELKDLGVLNKSGMILYEYFLNEDEMERFLNFDDADYEPSIEFIFTESV